MDDQTNTVIVFHSYPKGPCIDGLLSCALAAEIFKDDKLFFIPYWRTEECFGRLKSLLQSLKDKLVRLVYVDCSPDLEKEVKYLSENIGNLKSVTVYDHHPLKDDTPMKKLFGNEKFQFIFDSDNCASVMLYRLLSAEQVASLQITNLVAMIQFSEYLGMDAKHAGSQKQKNMAETLFQNLSRENSSLEYELNLIKSKGISHYFLLDKIIPDKSKFAFLYQNEGTDKNEEFLKALRDFVATSNNIINGVGAAIFTKESLGKYLNLIEEMEAVLNQGYKLESKVIGGSVSSIFVVAMDIFQYGRTLEFFIEQKLNEIKVEYAILMNKPTKTSSGENMHYFSLRRVSNDYDARDVVTFVKDTTGSQIGGGHAWASGITLNEEQYQKFVALQ